MPYDPKPEKRYRATLSEWEWFRTWFASERCWVCAGAWEELHHIYPRSQGGDDDIVNLAPLCQKCHHLVTDRDVDARTSLREALQPANYHYLFEKLQGRSEAWLERSYPLARVA